MSHPHHSRYTKLELNNRLKGPGSVLKLNIKMPDLHHEVWRTLLIPKDSTFYELHWCIQGMFHWMSYHMFEFKKGRQTIEDPEMQEQMYVDQGTKMFREMIFPSSDPRPKPPPKNARKVKLSRYLGKVGDEIIYEYDFGDSWIHLVKVEGILDPEEGKKYPLCVAGERAGPPEDVGGPGGYKELCEAFGKSKKNRTKDEKEKMEWLQDLHPCYAPDNWGPERCRFEIREYQGPPIQIVNPCGMV